MKADIKYSLLNPDKTDVVLVCGDCFRSEHLYDPESFEKYARVARDIEGDFVVSTVLLCGYPVHHPYSKPTFETMTSGIINPVQHFDRYDNLQSAKAGHKRALQRIKDGKVPCI